MPFITPKLVPPVIIHASYRRYKNRNVEEELPVYLPEPEENAFENVSIVDLQEDERESGIDGNTRRSPLDQKKACNDVDSKPLSSEGLLSDEDFVSQVLKPKKPGKVFGHGITDWKFVCLSLVAFICLVLSAGLILIVLMYIQFTPRESSIFHRGESDRNQGGILISGNHMLGQSPFSSSNFKSESHELLSSTNLKSSEYPSSSWSWGTSGNNIAPWSSPVVLPEPCTLREFQCDDGECILTFQSCDGRKDCADGSDEDPAICEGKPVRCMSRREFRCTDGTQCIPMAAQCDGNADCNDGSDESVDMCGELPSCDPKQEFKCLKGDDCIAISDTCNGRVDCEDGSDEANSLCVKPTCELDDELDLCNGYPNCKDYSDEKGCIYSCIDFEFTAQEVCAEELPYGETYYPNPIFQTIRDAKGFRRLIRHSMDCNPRALMLLCGILLPECPNTSMIESRPARLPCRTFCDEISKSPNCTQVFRDENLDIDAYCKMLPEIPIPGDPEFCTFKDNSPTACNGDEYFCASGDCIPTDYVCDSKEHCIDGSDEIHCTKCTVGNFLCNNGTCIPEDSVCDKFNDCGDNSDEVNCQCDPEVHFVCQDTSCLFKEFVCNGWVDCYDGSDEIGCEEMLVSATTGFDATKEPPTLPTNLETATSKFKTDEITTDETSSDVFPTKETSSVQTDETNTGGTLSIVSTDEVTDGTPSLVNMHTDDVTTDGTPSFINVATDDVTSDRSSSIGDDVTPDGYTPFVNTGEITKSGTSTDETTTNVSG